MSSLDRGPAWTRVGSILDSRGVATSGVQRRLRRRRTPHFGITQLMQPGTYYVQVGHWDPTGTGAYNVRMRADARGRQLHRRSGGTPAESRLGPERQPPGQHTLRARCYTYDAERRAAVARHVQGVRQQADGFLPRAISRVTNGPAFNASPWDAASVTATAVGTMRLAFTERRALARCTYTFNGAQRHQDDHETSDLRTAAHVHVVRIQSQLALEQLPGPVVEPRSRIRLGREHRPPGQHARSPRSSRTTRTASRVWFVDVGRRADELGAPTRARSIARQVLAFNAVPCPTDRAGQPARRWAR